eukprot:TRINITY_DN5017_c0_g1_i1.p1 TRINITY_DN5017_c0_g1~~TRINITY_DN5017_c0_g1_i1.p1  ORF type:complete len:386 (+),score=105.76 TRINITY_DN5017_c0_g1_i1:40-1197(+)
MANYSSWDAKATALCKEAEDEDEREKKECDEALGLTEGPKGPATEKAKNELKELDDHSKQRNDFIEWSKDREVTLTHSQGEVVLEGPEVEGKAVRLKGSKGVSYIVPAETKVLKLMMDDCSDCKLSLLCSMITSTAELYRCKKFELVLETPLGTLQVDECVEDTSVRFAEQDHVGRIYHQNSPGLAIGWGSAKLETIGIARAAQFVTRVLADGRLETTGVRRGEGEFPIDLPTGAGDEGLREAGHQPEPEAVPASEERRKEAEKQRQAGNEMFRASDFAQAAALYSLSLQLDPEQGAVWANRAQCWLKLGDHEKALADATKCSEVDPKNPKGWFRKGMSLHAMKRYAEAIPALIEAEKLEPTNKQVTDAIKMAQMMARKAAASGY